jgi:uncharacterized protein YdaU (DUF1376 family)
MKKETFYFSHDYTTRADEKIKNLMFNFGPEGYGIYWILIEELYQNSNQLQTNYKRIAYDIRVDEEKVRSIVEDFGLFIVQEQNFGSTSVQRRIDLRDEKSNKAKESAQRRWNNNTTASTNSNKFDATASKKDTTASKFNAAAEQQGYDCNAINININKNKLKETSYEEVEMKDKEGNVLGKVKIVNHPD